MNYANDLNKQGNGFTQEPQRAEELFPYILVYQSGFNKKKEKQER